MSTKYVVIPALAFVFLAADAKPLLAEEINCPPNIIRKTVDNVFVNARCTIRDTTVEGNIVVTTNGELLVQGATIKGSVQAEGAKRVRLQSDPNTGRDTEIVGDVQIKNTTAGLTSTIIDARVGGTILIDGNAAAFNVFGNDVGGDVQMFQNSAVLRLRDNTIDGNLQCKENSPAPRNGGGNVVGGTAEDQCARFAD